MVYRFLKLLSMLPFLEGMHMFLMNSEMIRWLNI